MSISVPAQSPGSRLRQLHDVALASPPAATALPLVYDPPAGRWKAQQIGTAGITDGAITFPKLDTSAGNGFDGRWVNVTGDTMSNALTIAYDGVPRISTFLARSSLQRPAYDFERFKTTNGVFEAVDVGSTIGTIGFSASSSTQMAYGGAFYGYVDAPISGGSAPTAFSLYQTSPTFASRETHRFDSYGRYFLNPPADVSSYATTAGLIVNGRITGTAGLWMTGVSAGVELGSVGTVNTPLIDFHSSANTHDFDSRIIASGGTATPGEGVLQIYSSFLDPSGTIRMSAGKKIDFAEDIADNKIDLYNNQYTIGIRGGTLAYFVPAATDAHRFYAANVERLAITGSLVKTTVPVEVGADSTSRLTAEIMATRAANPTHGLVYLGNTGTRYLLWDTGTLQLQAGAVEIPLTIYAGNTNGSGLRMGAPPGGHQWIMYSQGSSAHLGAAGSLLFRNENTGWQPLELSHWGEAKFTGRIVGKADMYLESDLHISRTAGGAPTTGVVYLGNANTAYLYFNGSGYEMPSYPLTNRGRPVVTATAANARNISVVTWTGNGGVQTVEMGVGAYANMVVVQNYQGLAWIMSYHPNVTTGGSIYLYPGGSPTLPNTGYCNCSQSYLYLNMGGGANIPNVTGMNYQAFCVGPG